MFLCSVLYIIVCTFVIFCWPLYCPFFFDLCLLITSLVYKNLLYTISWCNLCQWFVESVWFSSWALWFLQFSRYSGNKYYIKLSWRYRIQNIYCKFSKSISMSFYPKICTIFNTIELHLTLVIVPELCFFNLLIILSYGKIKKLWQTGGKGTYFIPITIKTGW